jgi:UDP-N-acetyl-D-galactosamine dehydrogenase
VGFDINAARIDELRAGRDSALEATRKELKSSKKLHFSSRPEELGSCNIYIVTVPTPIDKFKRPDLLLFDEKYLFPANQTDQRL